jgi:hypothetical protein
MLNTRGLLTSLALAPLLMLACQTSDSGNNGNSGSGGHTSGSGGAPGSGGSGSGGSTNNGSGGSSSGSGGTPMPGSGGSAGKDAGTDLASGSGGMVGSGGAKGSGGAVGSGGTSGNARCNAAGLNWKSGSKTNFQSYPDPGSVECIQFSGCDYVGQFAACNKMEPKSWVMSHNIVAVFPQGNLFLHDLCLKSGSKTIVVTALDTCADSDCSGCCTENKGNADLLVDVEEFTDARWGVDDGPIQWADLGPTTGGGCN